MTISFFFLIKKKTFQESVEGEREDGLGSMKGDVLVVFVWLPTHATVYESCEKGSYYHGERLQDNHHLSLRPSLPAG